VFEGIVLEAFGKVGYVRSCAEYVFGGVRMSSDEFGVARGQCSDVLGCVRMSSD
jgi:hypothetical protein